MSRTPRRQQWTDEACYHVMNRGHNRERIFGDDDDRRHFLRVMQEDPKEPSIRRADWVVGDESFQKRLQGQKGRAVQRRRGRPSKSEGL